MKNLVVLTGAGISAESGLKTFRDADGLWEGHDVMEVATPQAWAKNPELVQRFYNERRKQLFEVEPNQAHYILAELEEHFDVHVITQNVDDLHERAGSSKVLHLHGELKKVRSSVDEHLIYDCEGWELKMGDLCEKGSQLRPHVVWFGEAVPMMEEASAISQEADIFIVVGTSLQVYPAAGLVQYAPSACPVYVVDPHKPAGSLDRPTTYIEEKASTGMQRIKSLLIEN